MATTDDSAVYLAVETADGHVERLRVEQTGPISIGRDPTCHVVLPSSEVSRRHVMLTRSGDARYSLLDDSANGTFVGDRAQRVRGASVDIGINVPFRVGPYRLRVLASSQASREEHRAILPSNAPPDAWSDAGPTVRGTSHDVPWPTAPAEGNPSAVEWPPAPAPAALTRPERPTGLPSATEGAEWPPVPAPAALTRPESRRGSSPVAEWPPAPRGERESSRTSSAAVPHRAPAELSGATKSAKYGRSGTAMVPVQARRQIHRMLLDHLDLARLDRSKMDDAAMRPKVREALTRIVRQRTNTLPEGTDIARLIDELTDEALGLGPLEALLADESVSEIMVVDPRTIYIEREGVIELTDLRFTDDDSVRAVIERIVTPLGRRIDESTPLVDARLKDGSRVNAIIPPLALRGPCITIRKFRKDPFTLDDLRQFGTLTEQMGRFLTRSVIARKNIVISGGTGSGKTTLLNVLSSSIPERERIVTIEDAAELRLVQPHVVSLEARPPNMEGKGAITIRDLLRNALRMRPDRIVVGECRGGEALDMLQAMNTGHEGSMTTTHANSPKEALARLETLGLMSGLDLPARAIREQIAASIHLIVQQTRFSDGSRRITNISEVVGLDHDGSVEHYDIFRFSRTGTGPNGEVQGEFRATGYLPSYLDDFITHGLVKGGDYL